MNNIIDVVTMESYPEAVSIDIDNIMHYYPKKEEFRRGEQKFTTYSCIDLKRPINNQFEILHCVISYGTLTAYIKSKRAKYLTREEARWYFYTFLILFPFINVLVKIILDLIWK